MVELSLRGRAYIAFALATVLAALPAFWPSPWAWLGLVGTQLCLGFAWRCLGLEKKPSNKIRKNEWRVFSALWLSAYGLFALFLYWPLQSLRYSGTLISALWLSAAVALLILIYWRHWPWLALAEQGNDRVNNGGRWIQRRKLIASSLAYGFACSGLPYWAWA